MTGSIGNPVRTGEPVFALTDKNEKCAQIAEQCYLSAESESTETTNCKGTEEKNSSTESISFTGT